MKTSKDYIAEMAKGILTDSEIITEDVKKKIQKALEINAHLTSCYKLQVAEVWDIYGKTPEDSGFYIILEGTRCGYKFFLNNNMKIVRKPNKNKAEVKYKYSLYNYPLFNEGFWMDNF